MTHGTVFIIKIFTYSAHKEESPLLVKKSSIAIYSLQTSPKYICLGELQRPKQMINVDCWILVIFFRTFVFLFIFLRFLLHTETQLRTEFQCKWKSLQVQLSLHLILNYQCLLNYPQLQSSSHFFRWNKIQKLWRTLPQLYWLRVPM